jgi:hypothetical protein
MAYIVADRVKETTTVTGTGPATLAGAASGYRSFASQLSIGDTCAYVIVNSNASEWETGIGTYSAVNTLTRTTVHASTNANAAVVFTAGVKDVFMGPTANTILSDVTSTDGSVTINQTGTISDLSVAVAPATLNVLVAVRNTTGATLVKGTVVYISGSTGQISTVTKAIADSDANSAQTLGMISADLDDNSNGYVTIIGLIDNVDTKGYSAGTQLYLSPTVAGEFTSTKPYAPNHLVYVGIVERGTVQGKIFVKVQNGYELDELHNVAAQSPSNGQTIVYNSTTELWEKNYPSLTNALSSVPVVSGAGNNLTFTAGSGVTSGAGGSLILQAGVQATTGGDGKVVVKQVAGQTSNLQEWQNNSGTILAQITNTANLGLGISPATKYHQAITGHTNTTTAPGNLQARWENDSDGGRESHLSLYHQYYPAFQIDRWFFVNNAGYSGGTTSSFGIGSLYASNNIFLKDMGLNFENAGIRFIQATSLLRLSLEASNRGFYIGNGNGTSSDVSTQIIPNVGFSVASALHTNYLFNVTTAGTTIKPHSASTKGLIVQGAASQTANLQEWQNSSGTILAYITASGALYDNAINAIPLPTAATVTAATGNGTTVTYTAANTFSVGQVVSITGLTITTGSSLNLSNQTITTASATQFTVTNATVGTAAATQSGTATIQSAGNSVTITAGNGSGVGAGGNIILQPGAQGTSGGDGIIQCTKKLQFYTGSSKADLAFQINNTTTGMWYNSGANMFVWTINNTDTICFRQGYIRLSKGGGIYWSNTTNDAITLAEDSSIYSASRGVFAVDASMQGTNSQGGSLAFKSFTTNFAANTNDWVMGPSAFQRLNCTTACSLTGIAPYTSGVHVDGRMIRVYNVGTANLTLSHNSASSTAANRMFSSTGADIILAPNDYAELIYDATSNGSGAAGWRVS